MLCCIQLQNVEKGFVRSRYNENGEYVLIIEKGYTVRTFDLFFLAEREREDTQLHHKLYGLNINHSDIPPRDPMLRVVPHRRQREILCCSPAMKGEQEGHHSRAGQSFTMELSSLLFKDRNSTQSR